MPDHSTGKPLQIGFIGGSINSAVGYTHFVATTMDGDWELAAGCFSMSREDNMETARRYRVPAHRTYPSWRKFLEYEASRLDAVAVLTPTPTHSEIVAVCLRKGIPVICEKALAGSSNDVLAIISQEQKHQAFLAVTYNYTGYPMLRELRHRIENGELGRILHFQAEMPQEGFIRLDSKGRKPVPQQWRLKDGAVPTIHLDLGVHLHQIVRYLTGDTPLEVVSDQSRNGWFKEVADNVSALCRYKSGMQGQFWFSKSALGHRNGLKIRIYGSRGAAEWEQVNPEELRLSHADGRRELVDRSAIVFQAGKQRYNRFKPGHPDGFLEAFANLYADIAEALLEYRRTGKWSSKEVFGSEMSLEGIRLLEAMVASSHSGHWHPLRVGERRFGVIRGKKA